MSGPLVAVVVIVSITAYVLVALCVARVWYRRVLPSAHPDYVLNDALEFGFFWPVTLPVSALFRLHRVAGKIVSHGIEPKADA